jgi:hypothetical protein
VTVRTDLRRKLELERTFLTTLERYHQGVIRDFTQSVAVNGMLPSLAERDQELSTLLREHYAQTQAAFTGDVSEALSEELALTVTEETAITAALLTFFDRTAETHALDINDTTEDDMHRAVRGVHADRAPDAPALQGVEVAVLGAAVLHHQLRARRTSIATTETQLAAEATKATEAEVLSGLQPTVTGGGPRQARPSKRWDSVGDAQVREAHLRADGQVVSMDQAFRVGGEQLMYPGDTSLGASIGNVINCRCSATYDAAEIAERRRQVQNGLL